MFFCDAADQWGVKSSKWGIGFCCDFGGWSFFRVFDGFRRRRGGGGEVAAGLVVFFSCVSTTAMGVPTATTSPSFTRIFVSKPSVGDGISVSTLSVATSKRDSSALMRSPGCFNHESILPSMTLSPILGITISIGFF